MNDFIVVQIFDTLDDLENVVATLVVRYDLSTFVQLHHRTFLAEFQHNVDVARVIEETVKADDVFVEQ